MHAGDSHVVLRQVLADFAQAGRNVDFALVDGDHTTDGVRRDLTDLLESPAVARTVILLHDMANGAVRAGVRAVDFARFPKVVYVDLGFVELAQSGGALTDHWGGLGLVIVDPDGTLIEAAGAPPVIRDIDRPRRRCAASWPRSGGHGERPGRRPPACCSRSRADGFPSSPPQRLPPSSAVTLHVETLIELDPAIVEQRFDAARSSSTTTTSRTTR